MVLMDPNEREAIVSADDTGLIQGEQLITEAETLLPLERQLPHKELHAALPQEHQAHATIDSLHNELSKSTPDRGTIETYVDSLRSLPELEAAIANWWDDPKTQRFIGNIGQIGL
jgi:hypothetical protein